MLDGRGVADEPSGRKMPGGKFPAWAMAPAVFAAMALATLHSVLFQSGNLVVSSPSTDLILQFLPWRDFGFGQLRHGNLPLWNPYVFGGAPYFAGFQSALLYPPNWLHLVLPLTTAINWIIAIHLFAAGYFTYLWCRGRGTSIVAALLAGIMFMFSGPYFLHIYAGHLPHLCVMVWVPLLLLAIDKLNETGSLHWCLLGILSVTMQIFGGHPQYLYYTGMATFLYTALTAIRSEHRVALCGGYVIIYTAACLLGAVQLLAGLQAAGESARSSGTDFGFASMFAMPPENFLTFFAPGFLGKLPQTGDSVDTITYFGRCYLWEMSIFISITGLMLALIGVIASRPKMSALRGSVIAICVGLAIIHRLPSNSPSGFAVPPADPGYFAEFIYPMGLFVCAVAASGFGVLLTMLVITAALSLGNHLPFYRALYDFLPEYNHFRSVSKFTFPMCLFLCTFAATGFDVLRAGTRTIKIAAVATGGLAIACAILAISIAAQSKSTDHGIWGNLLQMIEQSHESYFPDQRYRDTAFISQSELNAAHSGYWAAATLATLCLLLCASLWKKQAAYGLIGLATIELCLFAHQNCDNTPGVAAFPAAWLSAIHDMPKDDRVVNTALPGGGEIGYLDAGMSLGIRNLWGYDPGVLKRYAETLAAAQGIDPDHASQYLQITHGSSGLFQMLRCGLALGVQGNNAFVQDIPFPLPVAQLVPHWRVAEDRDSALATINSNDFDPRKMVVLESSPGIDPSDDAVSGPADVVASTTDSVEIRTTIPAPGLLLITDNYSAGWHATALDGSTQSTYQILPANYTLMAIPLQAGTHHLRIEYLPAAYRIGKWISIPAWLAYGVAIAFLWSRRRKIILPSSAQVPPPEM
jgi:hypothetical protein